MRIVGNRSTPAQSATPNGAARRRSGETDGPGGAARRAKARPLCFLSGQFRSGPKRAPSTMAPTALALALVLAASAAASPATRPRRPRAREREREPWGPWCSARVWDLSGTDPRENRGALPLRAALRRRVRLSPHSSAAPRRSALQIVPACFDCQQCAFFIVYSDLTG